MKSHTGTYVPETFPLGHPSHTHNSLIYAKVKMIPLNNCFSGVASLGSLGGRHDAAHAKNARAENALPLSEQI